MTPPLPPGWICNRKVGFLFPRLCGRTTPIGCPHCRNGEIQDDPYDVVEREYFVDWGDFSGWSWGDSSGSAPVPLDAMDFTEADAGAMADDGENGVTFENDAGGS